MKGGILSLALGALSFIFSHFLLMYLDSLSLQFIFLIFIGVAVEELLKISTAKLAKRNLYGVALGFGLAESVYYYSLFGPLVLWNRVISTISHLVFAWIYLRYKNTQGIAAAILTHVMYNACWLL